MSDPNPYAHIERRATRFTDSNGQPIHRLDWVRFVYYDRKVPVAGGEGPVMIVGGELAVVQVCPSEVISTDLASIAAGVRLGDMDWWVEGWIDMPRDDWRALKHTGDRPWPEGMAQ